MKYRILNKINAPDDVKALNRAEISALISEIRMFLIDHVTRTGGHLASNLGVVELTVALHRVFNTPDDRIVFDVGHQSYVHKLLTGRRDAFETLRTNGGLSGFPRPEESPHDAFLTGHSSTSVSVAAGFAQADRILGKKHCNIAVVGDGAFTGGMIHEALNNVLPGERLIIILNENEMSIAPNTGKFAKHLAKLRSTESYFGFKRATRDVLTHIPLVGKPLVNGITSVKQSFKNGLYRSNYFEDLGIQYLGPVDGNDFDRVEMLLLEAKRMKDNVVVHIKTRKGCGFPPAEKDPDRFHGIPPMLFHNHTPSEAELYPVCFSSVFGQALLEAMQMRTDIAAITASMPDGTGLIPVQAAFPDRVFDVGIAESHAVTFAAGLAAGGVHPVFAVYSSFLQRGYDNLIHDVGIERIPVTLCIDHAGFNESDGVTHNGLFDVSMLGQIPSFTLYAPLGYEALRHALSACLSLQAPSAIRYPKGAENPALLQAFQRVGALPVLRDFDSDVDAVIVTYGPLAAEARRAEELLQENGIRLGTIVLEQLMPYSVSFDALMEALPRGVRLCCFAEEGIRNGGCGMILQERLRTSNASIHTILAAVDDPFCQSEIGRTMRAVCGIDGCGLADRIRQTFQSIDT